MNEIVESNINKNQAVTSFNSLLNVIERVAQNPDIDIAKMSALLDMQERIMNKNAEIAFNGDFSRMSMELPRIFKTKEVAFKNKETGKMETAYSYEDIVDIDDAVRPILVKYGFTLSFVTDVRDGGGIIVKGILSHIGGHSRQTSFPLALDTSGGKNNLQAAGSTMKYGIRYATKTLLNLIVVDKEPDTDGIIPEAPISEERFNKIIELMNETNTDTEAFCKHLKIKAIREMPNSMFQKAEADLKGKKAKMGVK